MINVSHTMYELKFYLDSNGEFAYKSSYSSGSVVDITMRFYDKETAIKKLTTIYNEISESIESDIEYINTIKCFGNYLPLVAKLSPVSVIFQIGNPTLEIELNEIELNMHSDGVADVTRKKPLTFI